MNGLNWPPAVVSPTGNLHDMSRPEIDQFLTCGRTGRLGMVLGGGPYVVPVGYAYAEGNIFFHTCGEGIKIQVLKENPVVCFEVDESLSDGSLGKSVVVFGRAEIIGEKSRMIPYLEKLIEKFRVPISFGQYMKNRDVAKELEEVRVVVITPTQVTGRSLVRPSSSFQ